ncbi:hypothetical protein JFL43_03045 [Viridibacillus sp. YIM B01967]|uniref:Uncharacterized protein n=1 Tax=Viridibacillus soli TaxID=2798301 RepID=A0ABS1H3H4_9BACL|nr:hypothetical protein [Viridibacillus soli]MBK3493851.1 hypothetical protein [Viridibacillus soli]
MEKKKIPIGLLLCLLCGGSWFTQRYQDHVEASINNSWVEEGDLWEKEGLDRLPTDIAAKLESEHISIIRLVGISEDTITISIDGRQQYVDENEKKIKGIVKELTRNTKYKDYPIRLVKAISSTPERNDYFKSLNIEKVKKGLKTKGYSEVQIIQKETEPDFVSINIVTSLMIDDSTNYSRGKKIEKEVRKIFTKEIEDLISDDVKVEIHVYNLASEKVN